MKFLKKIILGVIEAIQSIKEYKAKQERRAS